MHGNNKRFSTQMFKCIICCGLLFFAVKYVLVGDENKAIPKLNDLTHLMIEAEQDNSERLLTVKNICTKYNLGVYQEPGKASAFKHPPAPQYSVFYIVRSRDLSYCPLYKASSTTWIYNLCLLMNVTEEELNSGKEQISTIARRAIPEVEFPEANEVKQHRLIVSIWGVQKPITVHKSISIRTEINKVFTNYVEEHDNALRATKKLLVVRHPFERLLSAYRDKLENSVAGREHGTLHFYRKYGGKIVEKYRGKNFTTPRVDQVIRQKNAPPPAGIEPTFREFVQYLIHADLANYGDDHWMPYYLFCTPCSVNYDIVAKVETLWRDQIYTIHKLQLQEVIKPKWRHSGGHPNASRIYFSQLNRDMVEKLYEKFRLDFELFDYSPEDYYKYATST